VDIDPGAVEIAKLRLWLSLVVDEDDIKMIKPLPNLDYKIVCGNSLLDVPKDLSNQYLFDDLKTLKHLYFNETNPTKKQEYKKQIDELISRITNGRKDFDFEVYFYEVVHDRGGFDVVIGNPPYVQLQKDRGSLAELYKNKGYETFERTGDIYALFYEKGLRLLRNNGHLCFITSNKWMRAGYGERLRRFFNKYNPLLLVDLGPGVFESATVDTNILIVKKCENRGELWGVTLTEDAKGTDLGSFIARKKISLGKMGEGAWFIGSKQEQSLKEKIECMGKALKEWDVNIYYGIKTGLNEAFIITTEKRNEILAGCKDEEERKRTEAIIKPILRGRDIKRYYYEWAGLWVIVIPCGRTDEKRGKQPPDLFIESEFPSVMGHLKQFEEKARTRDDQGDYWWELRHCAYYAEFEKEKVIYSEIVRQPQFCLDHAGMFVEATSFLMTGEHLRYICALLNSDAVSYFFKTYYAGGGLGDEGYRYKKAFLGSLPIPPITPSNKPIVEEIEQLVDKIVNAKRQDPRADTTDNETQIDHLVYQLYSLTEEEIGIIENSFGGVKWLSKHWRSKTTGTSMGGSKSS